MSETGGRSQAELGGAIMHGLARRAPSLQGREDRQLLHHVLRL